MTWKAGTVQACPEIFSGNMMRISDKYPDWAQYVGIVRVETGYRKGEKYRVGFCLWESKEQ